MTLASTPAEPAAAQNVLATFDSPSDGEHVSETAQAARILLAVLLLAALWVTAVIKFGVPGLYLPALGLVPVIWVLILAITMGK